MTLSIGEQLRNARAEKKTSLSEISDQTRISVRHLEAIEANEFNKLPGGIYTRSFIKAYARSIGLDEEELMQQYAAEVREKTIEEDAPLSSHQPKVYTDVQTARSSFKNLLLTIVTLGVLWFGAYIFLEWYQTGQLPFIARFRSSAPAAVTPAAPPTNANADSGAPAPNTNSAPASPAAPLDPNAFKIMLKVNKEVWLMTKADDNKQTASLLKAGETREYEPQRQLLLRYAKEVADGIEVQINGRAARVSLEGKPGQGLAEMLITRDGYQQLLQ